MVNCNPETVSTDYDTSDRLYFEPLTLEDVLAVYEHEAQRRGDRHDRAVRRPDAAESGAAARAAGVPIIGTSPESIDLAEDRKRFGKLLDELEFRSRRAALPLASRKRWTAPNASAIPCSCVPATCSADAPWSSPTTTRPSSSYMQRGGRVLAGAPGLIDHFLEDAVEVDVDALCDGEDVVIARHHAAHRGSRHPLRRFLLRAAAVDIARALLDTMREYTFKLARALKWSA